MKSLYSTLLFSLASYTIFAQSIPYTSVGSGVATTFETDYHCLGINTSALGWGTGYEGKRITFSTSESNLSIFSPALDSKKFANFSKIIRTQINNKTLDPATSATVLSSAGDYAKAGFRINGDVQWLGFSFQGEKFGGIAFSMGESYGMSSKVNLASANVLFQGQWQNLIDTVSIDLNGIQSRVAYNQTMRADSMAAITSVHLSTPLNLDAFTNGSNAQVIWNRNYNIGYGRKILGKDSVFVLYGGIGARYIQSMAYYELNSDADGLQVSSSLSTTTLNQGGLLTQINPLNSSSIGGFFTRPVGSGYGIDLSASIILLNKFRIAAAVNNLGAVKYDRYKYIANPTISQEIAVNGLDPVNPANTVQELMRGNQLLVSTGKQSYKLQNAASVRLGASWKPIKQLHFGIDMVSPFNKDHAMSIQDPIFAIGLDARPVKWVSLNIGLISGGVYNGNIPMGINFILKGGAYEFGVSSHDIVHFLTKNGNSVSAAFGFARIRI